MTGLDFFVALTITGTVLGLDHTSDAAAVHGTFGAQVHRLPWLVRDHEVEPVLVEGYGRFPDRVDLDELLKAVAEQGFPVVERPYRDEGHVDFWSPVSHMGVLAERGGRDVVKLLGPTHHSPSASYPEPVREVRVDVRAARSLRDQIHEVARALPWLTDAAMTAELREWHTVKPNLLAG